MNYLVAVKVINVVIVAVMALICVCDIRWKQIPISYICILLSFAGILGIMRVAAGDRSILEILGAAVPGLFLLLLALTTQNVGSADGPVLIALGLTFGAENCFTAFLVSLLLTGVFGIVMMLFKKYSRRTQVPYCPFVAGAFALVITCGL